MTTALLQTKLYVPPARDGLVKRPRLIEKLNQGLQLGSKLTLVSAPAGFGKTTLVSEWIAGRERPSAWLSLDENDSEYSRFLTYFIAALRRLDLSGSKGIEADIGKRALELLQSPRQPTIETILTNLLNEIAGVADNFILVLDDYHVVDAKAVDQTLTFLLNYAPPQMHLVITTREDPQLPLSGVRARGQMTELRAADLRFTADEAAAFLNQAMGLKLSVEDIISLERRTEGWIAGLQMAAIAMQSPLLTEGQTNIQGFIRTFAGDNRYIMDFLVEEVLQQQPEKSRSFLLQTSILDQMCGPLCDAVTNHEGGHDLLKDFDRANLFVVPLDDKRRWYRYHHLFADVLQARLLEKQPELLPTLHRRASEWCEQNELTGAAVRHAFAAGEFERAADLIELSWPEMDRNRQPAVWLGWVRKLPEALLRARPVLIMGTAWALLSTGQLEAGEAKLREAERWLSVPPGNVVQEEMVVVDEERFQALPVSIATARAYHAQAVGDVSGTVKHARRALELLPEGDSLRRGRPASILALGYWSNGELEAAAQALAETMQNAQLAGNAGFTITGTYVLADMLKTLGRLQEAIDRCLQSLQLAVEHPESVYRGTADIHVALGGLYLEQGDLKAADRELLRSEELGEKSASPYLRYRLCLAQARLKHIQGEFDDALQLLDEAERRYIRGPAPEARPVPALKARVWLAQGRLAESRRWMREQGLSFEDDLHFLREFEHITLARVLTADYKRYQQEEALLGGVRLLKRLLEAAESGGRMGSVIEILVNLAVAYEAQNNIPAALAALERALHLAGPEGCTQLFLEEGMPMAKLLSEAAEQGIMPEFTGRLLDVFQAEKQEKTVEFESPTSFQPLVEPLSQRELEVLRLLAEGLSNREIGERLFLALPTIKGHNRNIYGKLHARRRTEAIARARELGLL